MHSDSLSAVRMILVSALGCLLLTARVCADDEGAAKIESVAVGFDGHYQLGRWSPITVEFDAPADAEWQLVVTVPDPDGHPTRRLITNGDLHSPGSSSATGMFRMGRLGEAIQVQLISGSDVIDTFQVPAADIEANRPLTTDSMLWLLVGETEIFEGVNEWLVDRAEEIEGVVQRDIVAVHSEDGAVLPTDFRLLESVDALVICGDYSLTSEQSEALREWVNAGGRLIVSIGSRWAEYESSPLSQWMPIEIGREKLFISLSPLTGLVASTTGIGLYENIVGVELFGSRGTILAEGSEGLLVVRNAYGLGTVTATAFDLDEAALIEWEPAPEFALALTGSKANSLLQSSDEGDSDGAIGASITELQTQLAVAVDQYPGVAPVTNFAVLGLLVLYLLAIGVLDYLLVHRALKKPQLTWITLPVWLLAGVLLTDAYGRSHIGAEDIVRRVELIDVASDTGTVRVRDWLGLYSSEAQRQDIRESIDADWLPESPLALSWSGLPETGFRGMYRQAGLNFGDPLYAYDRDTLGLDNFPRLPNASRVLEGQAILESPGIVESQLRGDRRGQLSGTFTHHLPAPITDWFVLYRNNAYYPTGNEVIPPDVEFSTEGFPHPVLKSFLTRASLWPAASSGDGGRAASRDEYDPTPSAEIAEILRMICFYAAADGESYSTLGNDYLGRLDLSEQIGLNRAIVFGRINESVVSLEVNGETVDVETQTYVRLVIPVEFD